MTLTRQQSGTSEPGRLVHLFADLPAAVDELCAIVHGVVAHRDAAPVLYGLSVPPPRRSEANTRHLERILERIIALDPRPLAVPRPPERRFLGSCRDFALLLCAMLRHHGAAARLRCGFADYWDPGLYVDHWVCEYWIADQQRWLLADAEVGSVERRHFGITLNHLDVPRDRFLVAGAAWQQCRVGDAEPRRFGVPGIGIRGWWFVRANLLRDLASLNAVELLPWDYTEFSDRQFADVQDLPSDEVALLDRLAKLTAANPVDLERVQALYADDPVLQVKDTIRSYTSEGPSEVKLLE